MAKKLQLRGGTTSQHSSFTGAVREVTVDTDKKVVVVHDGSTAGGIVGVKASDIANASNWDTAYTDRNKWDGGATGLTAGTGRTSLGLGSLATLSSVDTAQITADAVDGTKIADDSLNSEHYIDGSIDLAHLSGDCVDGTKLADNACDSEHYTDGSIDNVHLATGIDASKLTTGTLPNARITALATSQLSGAVTSISSHGLATSATTDTTSATNISSGTLNTARLPATCEMTTLDLGDWTVTESGGVLYFKHSGTNKMKIDSSGNLTVVGNVTAYGSV